MNGEGGREEDPRCVRCQCRVAGVSRQRLSPSPP